MKALSLFKRLTGQKQITTRAAAHLTGMGMSATSMALKRLAAEGLVSRIKPGSWLVGTAATKPGALVAAAAHPYKAYLSGWSALRHHRRIQQIPGTHFGVTLGRSAEHEVGGTGVQLHHINPALFTGYVYDPALDGLVASPEKAIFDTAYFSSMNRRPLSGTLPETDLKGIRWAEIQKWIREIPSQGVRTSVERRLKKLREQQTDPDD